MDILIQNVDAEWKYGEGGFRLQALLDGVLIAMMDGFTESQDGVEFVVFSNIRHAIADIQNGKLNDHLGRTRRAGGLMTITGPVETKAEKKWKKSLSK